MKKQRSDTRETRRRVLSAAGEVFAEKGFWKTTHADICRKARVNTAAVNYHFGSKENLYVEAWKHAFARSMNSHPVDGGIRPDAPAQEKLRGRILSFLQRIADPQTNDLEIMHKEMVNPTGLLRETIAEAMEPIDRGLEEIIRELLGGEASQRRVLFCSMSIMSQCLGVMMHFRARRKGPTIARRRLLDLDFDVEEAAEHILRFSLAGIRDVREAAEVREMDAGKAEVRKADVGYAENSGQAASGKEPS